MWYSYASHIPVICWSHTTHMTAICQSNVYAFYLRALSEPHVRQSFVFCNICQLFLYTSILMNPDYNILYNLNSMTNHVYNASNPILLILNPIWPYSVLCFHINLVWRISYDMLYNYHMNLLSLIIHFALWVEPWKFVLCCHVCLSTDRIIDLFTRFAENKWYAMCTFTYIYSNPVQRKQI